VVTADGRQIGNRFLLRAAGVGDILIAEAGDDGDPSDLALSDAAFPTAALPAGTLPVRALPDCALIAFTGDHATMERADVIGSADLDAWIVHVSDAVARAHGPHQGGRVFRAGDISSLPAGAEFRGGREPVWVEVTDGIALLFGDSAHGAVADRPWPLTGAAWVTTGETGATVRATTTEATLTQDGWREALRSWHRAMLATLASSLLMRETEEEDRVRRSTQWSAQVLRATQAGIGDTLSGRSHQRPRTGEEPLLAACRIVAGAMGFELSEQPARPSSQALGRLERIVHHTRTPARQVTLQGHWWRDQLGPMIAFRRDDGRPVALLPGSARRPGMRPFGTGLASSSTVRGKAEWAGRGYVLHDPSNGSVERLTRDAAATLDSSAYVLYPSLPDRPLRARDLLRFGLRETGRDIALMLFMGLISALLGLAIPAATAVLVDEFIPSRLETPLLQMGALMLLGVVVIVVVNVTQDLAQVRIAGRGANRLQPAVMDRTIRLPTDFLKHYTSADLAERVRVIDAIRAGLDAVVIDAMLTGLFSLTTLAFLFLVSPPLALVAMLLAVPMIVAAAWASQAQLPALRVVEARGAETAQLVYQLVDNISHLRAAGAEERAFARWGRLYQEYQTALLRATRIGSALAGFSAAYGVIGLAAFFVALQRLPSSGLSVGQMVMMVSIYGGFVGSATGFASGLQRVFHLQPKLQRARPLLAATPEVDPNRLDPGELSGRIEVSQVSFGYVEGAEPTVRDLSLTIEPGEFVALVGPSGCGKTTLLKLLLGFEHPRTGGVLYDGRDLRRLDMRALRRQIGTVLQSDRLMPGTLFENILGVSGRPNEDAWDAARQAGIAGEIEDMPMGMHTLLTDGGSTLSGGQIQRLLVARALIGDPRITFLDEATSALDNRSQAIVMESLARMAVTRVVIAHRLSTVRDADRIIVMESGRIVQTGRYDDLMRQPGLFADLVRRQEE